MNTKVHVAFIDDGINNKQFPQVEFYKNLIIQSGQVIESSSVNDDEFSHATTCAAIFLKYTDFSRIKLSNVKILSNHGKGNVDDLISALNWCLNNNVKVINLSLGCIDFMSRKKLQECINRLFYVGIILIAASENCGLLTYPASFSNVIGVKATLNYKSQSEISRNNELFFDGIDLCATSRHSLNLNKKSIETSNSNSFATPYITSLVTNLLMSNFSMDMVEVRKNLLQSIECLGWSYKFDWSLKSIVICFESIFFFDEELECKIIDKVYVSNQESIESIIDFINQNDNAFDTLILVYGENTSMLERFLACMHRLKCRNIVFIDLYNLFSLHHYDFRNFSRIWTINDAHGLLLSSFTSVEEAPLDIPVVVVCDDNLVRLCQALLRIRQHCNSEEYNCKCGINNAVGVLYDFVCLENISDLTDSFFQKLSQIQLLDIIVIGCYVNKSLNLKINIEVNVEYDIGRNYGLEIKPERKKVVECNSNDRFQNLAVDIIQSLNN